MRDERPGELEWQRCPKAVGLGWLKQLHQAEPLGILATPKQAIAVGESVLKVILHHSKIKLVCFLFLILLRRFHSS